MKTTLLLGFHLLPALSLALSSMADKKIKVDDNDIPSFYLENAVQYDQEDVIQNVTLLQAKMSQLHLAKRDHKDEDDETLSGHCQRDLDAAIQNATLLQAKMDRIVDEFNAELDSLENELKKKAKQVESAEERYREARKKLIEAEGELKFMHKQALSSYVNFTLLHEDVVNGIENRVFMTGKYVQNLLKPRVRWAASMTRRAYRAEQRHLQPKRALLKRKVDILSNKFDDLWSQSTFFRPFVERTMLAVSTKVYSRIEPSIKVAQEAVYFSVVSVIEEVSRAAINYLDALAEKRKKKVHRNQELQLERRRRETTSRHKRHLDNIRRDMEKRKKNKEENDMEFTPSFFLGKAKEALEYSLTHSKQLANRASALLPLALSLLVARKFLIGSALLLLGIPSSLIWFICLVSFFRLFRSPR
jgi:hypothetical protein